MISYWYQTVLLGVEMEQLYLNLNKIFYPYLQEAVSQCVEGGD